VRDRRFVAVHRGGPLSREDHRKLARWAARCALHMLDAVWTPKRDRRPYAAVQVALAWSEGRATTGEAMRAAVAAHAAARSAKRPAAVFAARAAGHAVATAHMAEHCLGVGYALKAALAAGLDVHAERTWQNRRLPRSVRNLVRSARASRGADPRW
jgi:hypothetical protein